MGNLSSELTERLKKETEIEFVGISRIIMSSIESCTTKEQAEARGGKLEDLSKLTPQTHNYQGLSPRFYTYGKGPIVRDDNPYFNLMRDSGFIDTSKGTFLAPRINNSCVGSPTSSISDIFDGPRHWFLSQKAVDLYLELKREGFYDSQK